jgi:hypothetical protein
MILSMSRADRLPGRIRIAAAQASADLGRVAGKVLADDVQAELAQDRGGGLAFEEEFERGSDQLLGGDVTAPEADGKSGRHTHLVAGARGCLDLEGVIGLVSDGELRHAVTLASRQSMCSWLGRPHYVPLRPCRHMPVIVRRWPRHRAVARRATMCPHRSGQAASGSMPMIQAKLRDPEARYPYDCCLPTTLERVGDRNTSRHHPAPQAIGARGKMFSQ